MELRNILTFLRAAELGNFSKAADMLGYAQSTVTMQIQQLEAELGSPLFERSNRAISLTSFGEALLPLARKMYQTAQEMQLLYLDPKEVTGTLRIGIVESLFFSDFLHLIPKYQALYPHVVLDFYTASSVEIADSLQKNKLDFGCYLSETTPSAPLIQQCSRTTTVEFEANKTHPLTCGAVVPLDRIAKEKFVLTEEISIYHQALMKLFYQRGLEIDANVRLKSTRGIVDVLQYSGGVSFLPAYALQREVQKNHLALIHTDAPPQEITVVVTTHKDRWMSPHLQSFLHLIQQEPWL